MNTEEFQNEDEFDMYVKGAWEERRRIVALLDQFASGECPDLCDVICECFAKHEARMFISIIEGGSR